MWENVEFTGAWRGGFQGDLVSIRTLPRTKLLESKV